MSHWEKKVETVSNSLIKERKRPEKQSLGIFRQYVESFNLKYYPQTEYCTSQNTVSGTH